MKLAFYKGKQRLFNRLVAWWTRGPYSHVELVFGPAKDGRYVCGSASHTDGGVRIKTIALTPDKWDVFDVDVGNAEAAKNWFSSHWADGYDYLGLFGFVLRRGLQSRQRWFCSEAVAAALGFFEPWRYDPNALFARVKGGASHG